MGGHDLQALRDGAARGALTGPSAPLELAIALARELLHATGALRVRIAVDLDPPVVVGCERFGAIVVSDARADRVLPHDAAADVALAALPLMRQLPAFEVDAAAGSVAGVLGGLEMLGRAVRGLAALLPGETVVAADFETTDPDSPLGLAGRHGQPVAVLLGEHAFELDC